MVRRSPGTIGYLELLFAMQNDFPLGLVQNRAGEYIKASLKSVTAAAADASAETPDDVLPYSITDAPGKDAYPISGTVWAVIYVNQPADKGQAVVGFLRWVTHDGQQYAEALHYSRLPQELVERVEKKLAEVKVGK